ncbi:RNHCP domain-containing protein [Evansella halocellulosilytica]|uniref:RNHCP domain-containing protein n=1 Tax=Evansella halocellulosilytica TaxID=2011013 RepID=UPI000BB9B1DE|nr:RNHCP domain-containing protein [Evansella halocellulosilytica]
MSRKKENQGFTCDNCQSIVIPLTNGSYRNHCPYCLFSKHVDIFPGDRQNSCKGLMEPVNVVYNSKKGYQIIHRCLKCNEQRRNKIALNTEQEDRFNSCMYFNTRN